MVMSFACSAALIAALAASVALILAPVAFGLLFRTSKINSAVLYAVWALSELVAAIAHILTSIAAASTDLLVSISAGAAAFWAASGLVLAVAGLVVFLTAEFPSAYFNASVVTFVAQVATLIAASPAWCTFALAARARSHTRG